MAINVNNAFVGAPPIDGGVYFNAPLGTKLPKKANEPLDPAFKDHGAVGEDGISVTPTRESTTEKMFGGGDFIDIQTGYGEEVKLTLLEDDNPNVIYTVYGDANVVTTAATAQDGTQRTIYHTKTPLPIKSHVVKAVYGDKSKTYVVEKGRVTTVEKSADVHSGSTKYTVTIKVFEGANGVYVTELRDDGKPTAPTAPTAG